MPNSPVPQTEPVRENPKGEAGPKPKGDPSWQVHWSVPISEAAPCCYAASAYLLKINHKPKLSLQ